MQDERDRAFIEYSKKCAWEMEEVYCQRCEALLKRIAFPVALNGEGICTLCIGQMEQYHRAEYENVMRDYRHKGARKDAKKN